MPRKIRPIRVEGNIAYVPLTQGHVAVIDAADVALVAAFNWYAKVSGNTVYAYRTDYAGPKPRSVLMHRTILALSAGLQVDHIDGNGLHNWRDNLREATNAQNVRNQRTRQDNSSGFKGAFFERARGKWVAQIRLHGRRRHLGYFTTPEEAHQAYCAASAKLHGEFGRTA